MNNITKRENILIIVLINLIAYYLLFNIIILPINTSNKAKNLEIEELNAQKEISRIEATKLESDLKQLQNLTLNIQELSKQIFSDTNEENIHYFFNTVAKNSNTTISSFKIEELSQNINEDTIENSLESELEKNNENKTKEKDLKSEKFSYNIEISLNGTYSNKLKFLKYLEAMNKTLKINEIEFLDFENNSPSKIFIEMYTIKKDKLDKEFQIN